MKHSALLNFGEGQPTSRIGSGWGYRLTNFSDGFFVEPANCQPQILRGTLALTPFALGNIASDVNGMIDIGRNVRCSQIRSLDSKIDDGQPGTGKMRSPMTCVAWSGACISPTLSYEQVDEQGWFGQGAGPIYYDLPGF
jgi:hypothetical protein